MPGTLWPLPNVRKSMPRVNADGTGSQIRPNSVIQRALPLTTS